MWYPDPVTGSQIFEELDFLTGGLRGFKKKKLPFFEKKILDLFR
jgi:hypothetical protein